MTHGLGCEPWALPGDRRVFKARTSGWSLLHHGHYAHLVQQWATQDQQLPAFSPSGYNSTCFAEVKEVKGTGVTWLEMPVTSSWFSYFSWSINLPYQALAGSVC